MRQLILLVFLVSIMSCSKQTTIELLDEIDNEITRDIKKGKFQWYYEINDYKEFSRLNELCTSYYEDLSVAHKKVHIAMLEDEARALALENLRGVLETYSNTDSIEKFREYLSGGALSLVNSSYGAKAYLESYDINEFVSKSEFKDFQTFLKNNKSQAYCLIITPILGALGSENIAKTTFERMSDSASRSSRQNLLKKLEQFQ